MVLGCGGMILGYGGVWYGGWCGRMVGCTVWGMLWKCGVGVLHTGGRLVENKDSNLNQSWSKNHAFRILIKAMFISSRIDWILRACTRMGYTNITVANGTLLIHIISHYPDHSLTPMLSPRTNTSTLGQTPNQGKSFIQILH